MKVRGDICNYKFLAENNTDASNINIIEFNSYDFTEKVFSLYLVHAIRGSNSFDYYVVAQSYDDAENKVKTLFKINKENDSAIVSPKITKVELLTEQIYSSSVGCATEGGVIPFIYDESRLIF